MCYHKHYHITCDLAFNENTTHSQLTQLILTRLVSRESTEYDKQNAHEVRFVVCCFSD